MKDFFETQLPAIITGILGVGAYIFERRRKHAEVQQVESDAIQAMQNAYKTFVSDSNVRLDEMRGDILTMKSKINALEANETLMILKIEGLEKEVIEWKHKYTSLKKEIELKDNKINTTPNDGKK